MAAPSRSKREDPSGGGVHVGAGAAARVAGVGARGGAGLTQDELDELDARDRPFSRASLLWSDPRIRATHESVLAAASAASSPPGDPDKGTASAAERYRAQLLHRGALAADTVPRAEVEAFKRSVLADLEKIRAAVLAERRAAQTGRPEQPVAPKGLPRQVEQLKNDMIADLLRLRALIAKGGSAGHSKQGPSVVYQVPDAEVAQHMEEFKQSVCRDLMHIKNTLIEERKASGDGSKPVVLQTSDADVVRRVNEFKADITRDLLKLRAVLETSPVSTSRKDQLTDKDGQLIPQKTFSKGLVKCQVDPHARSLSTRVVSCRKGGSARRQNANERPEKADKQQQRQHEDRKEGGEEKKHTEGVVEWWEVVLEDTVLFPEGGGQPSDKGWIGESPVFYVFRDADNEQAVTHCCELAVQEGATVEVRLNWQCRVDHMQQHSAQHLISALAHRMFGLQTLSWWLSQAPNDCFVELKAPSISFEIMQQLEDAVNEQIRAAVPVTLRVFADSRQAASHPQASLSRQPLVKDEDQQRAEKGDNAGSAPLPQQYRVVEIEGLDFNTCCGTHVRSTQEIQLVKLISAQTGRGSVKLFYVAGERARSRMSRMLDNEHALVAILQANPSMHAQLAEKHATELRQLNKQHKALMEEVAEIHGSALGKEVLSQPPTKCTVFHRGESGFPLGRIADAFSNVAPQHLAFFSCGPPENGQFVLIGNPSVVSDAHHLVCEVLQARGGLRNGRFQGKATLLTELQIKQAVRLVEECAEEAATKGV